MARRIRTSAAAVACLLALTSCGSTSPGEQAPALQKELAAIDEALAQEQYAEAEQHLESLVAAAEEARAAGDLDDGDADRVLAAAARLLAELPGAPEPGEPSDEVTPESSPSESPTPETSDEGEDTEDSESDEEAEKEAEKEAKEAEKEAEKAAKEQEKEDKGKG